MSDKKLFTAKEAAQAVLNKAKDILKESALLKAEYPTENHKESGVKYGKIEKDQKALERDYDEYEVKKPGFKDSNGKRLEKQVSPSENPKEAAEKNNKPDGMEPEYEFKDKVSKELAKEKDSHMVKSQSGMHTVVYQTMEKSEKLEKGEWKKIHDKLEREGYSKESADKIDGAIKAKMGKAEDPNKNPDKEADAELGEQVEHDVEEHMKENAAAEQQEGHSMAKPGDKMEPPAESAVIPALVGSAKLAKFMERKHSKRKAAQAQAAQGAQSQAPSAVGHPAAAAPAARSTQAGKPDPNKV